MAARTDDTTETALDRLAQGIDYTINGRPCFIPTEDGGRIPTLDYTGITYFSTEDLDHLAGWALDVESTSGHAMDEDGLEVRFRLADKRYKLTIWEGPHRPVADVTPLD